MTASAPIAPTCPTGRSVAITLDELDVARLQRMIQLRTRQFEVLNALLAAPDRYRDLRVQLDELESELDRAGNAFSRSLLSQAMRRGVTEIAEPCSLTGPSQADEPIVPALTQQEVDDEIARVRARRVAEVQRAKPVDDRSALQRLLDDVGINPAGRIEETLRSLDLLEQFTSDENLVRWSKLTKESQRALLRLAACWARHSQDAGGEAGQSLRVAAVFRALRTFSRHANPGFANGLAKDHVPDSGAWTGDAMLVADELFRRAGLAVCATEQHLAVLDTGRPETEFDEDEDGHPAVPEDWPFLPLVRGATVAMIGGTPREDRRAALEAEFNFARLDWIECDKPRATDALAARICGGTVNVVLIVGSLASHKAFHKISAAAKASGVRHATVARGYGIRQLMQAIEMAFRQAPPGPNAS